MTWAPTHLTRDQLEERRLEGGRLLRAGKLAHADIARALGVSRATVSDWAKRYAQGGMRALHRQRGGGVSARLTTVQQKQLLTVLKRGARAAGFPTERWTMGRVQTVIQREFHVSYHKHYINRFLRRLGWSPQQPLTPARERDEQLIQAWLAQDWPRIKKGAAAAASHRVL